MDNDKIIELKEKLAKDPSSKLFVPLAEEYRKAGFPDEAINILKRGIERQPRYTSALVALGKIYFEKGMFVEARAEFEKVVSQVPDNLFAHRKLADVYKRLGERDKAVEQYRRVLKLNPMDDEAQGILEELSKPPVAVPEETIEAVEELPAEDAGIFAEEDSLIELGVEAAEDEFAEVETLTPLGEEEEAAAEFLEAFEEEAAPVEIPEYLEEDESVEDIAEAFEFEEADEEAEFLEALEEETPVEDLVEAAAEAEAILEEAESAEEGFGTLEEETEPIEDIAEVLEEEEFLEAVEEVIPLEEIPEELEAAEEIEEVIEEAASIEAAPVEEAVEAAEEIEEVIEEAAPVEEALEATEEIEEVIEEAVEEVSDAEEAMPMEAESFGETGFADLAAMASEEEEYTIEKAQECASQNQYDKAADVYRTILARDPENIKAKQGLQETESLLKLMGTEKEVIIGRLEAFLKAIIKRKNEFYRNA